MADIAPFRALRYSLSRVGRIEDVVTPPYDVLSPADQEAYHQASPYNIVRLELGKRLASDNGHDNPARRAAALLARWRQEGVLERDPADSFYYCETDFEVEGQARCRQGFIGLVRAEEFGGWVRRHEMTFSRVKADRLRLIQECRANLSPVFGLYDDREDAAVKALAAARVGGPEFEFADRSGCRHRLWRVSEPAAIQAVRGALQESLIVVADGHHRYETAVMYAGQMRQRFPEAPADAPFNYVMMYLCSSSAPGLTVLPAHRVLAPPPGFSLEEFERRAQDYFRVRHFAPGEETSFLAALHANGDSARNSLGLFVGGAAGFRLLTLKDEVMAGPAGEGLAEPLRHLDVVVFGRVILQRLLGLPGDEDEGLIQYVSETAKAIEAAAATNRLAFLLNPTRVEQVQEVARHALTMPRKSTYFYPKVMSGLTIHPLDWPPEG